MSQLIAGRSFVHISRTFNRGLHTNPSVLASLPLRRPPYLSASTTQQVRRITQSSDGSTLPDKKGTDSKNPGGESLVKRINTALDEMGATRGVKITILIFLSIVGTMETMFYVKAAHRWLYPRDEEEDAEGQK